MYWTNYFYALIFCLTFGLFQSYGQIKYTPDWDSLDARPLPEWYDNAKIGIFLHWGVYSVPSLRTEWFWWWWKGDNKSYPIIPEYMKNFYSPNFAYPDFAQQFRNEFFEPNYWVDLFSKSGAMYIVLTAKHHEGFCLWPSNSSWQWNSVDIGPRMDLIEKLSTAIRNRTTLRFGVYYSLFEWFHPLYLKDKRNIFFTQDFIKYKTSPELMDLVERYKPEIIWSDGDAGTDTYWNSTHFLAWLYNDSPVKDTVVTNDRWGTGCVCKHGGFYTCGDHYRPGELITHKWENCMTLDRHSWGYRREAKLSDILSPEELIQELVSTVAYGGNILINVGPTAWGTIAPIFEERLLQLGEWLSINGKAIYGSRPWKIQLDPKLDFVWYTTKLIYKSDSSKLKNLSTLNLIKQFLTQNDTTMEVYAILTKLPNITCDESESFNIIVTDTNENEKKFNLSQNCQRKLTLESIQAKVGLSEFILFDGSPNGIQLSFEINEFGVTIILPSILPVNLKWAWTICMKNIT